MLPVTILAIRWALESDRYLRYGDESALADAHHDPIAACRKVSLSLSSRVRAAESGSW